MAATTAHMRHCFAIGMKALRSALLRKGFRTSDSVAPLPNRYSHSDWYCFMSSIHCRRPRSQACQLFHPTSANKSIRYTVFIAVSGLWLYVN